MEQPWAAEDYLKLLLRAVGGLCLLGLISLWMPRSWIEATHRWLGWGEFPAAPIALYLARSVSALTAFYGGLLVALSFDVRRYLPLIHYQALAIMALSEWWSTAGPGCPCGSWVGMRLLAGRTVSPCCCWPDGSKVVVLSYPVRTRRSEHAGQNRAGRFVFAYFCVFSRL